METTTPAPGPPKTILMVNTAGASGTVTFQSMNASVPLPSCLDSSLTQPQVPPNTASSATGVYLMGPAWTTSEGKMVLAWPGDPGDMNVVIMLSDGLPLACGSAGDGSGGGDADSGCWEFTPGTGAAGEWTEIGSHTWEDLP